MPKIPTGNLLLVFVCWYVCLYVFKTPVSRALLPPLTLLSLIAHCGQRKKANESNNCIRLFVIAGANLMSMKALYFL